MPYDSQQERYGNYLMSTQSRKRSEYPLGCNKHPSTSVGKFKQPLWACHLLSFPFPTVDLLSLALCYGRVSLAGGLRPIFGDQRVSVRFWVVVPGSLFPSMFYFKQQLVLPMITDPTGWLFFALSSLIVFHEPDLFSLSLQFRGDNSFPS